MTWQGYQITLGLHLDIIHVSCISAGFHTGYFVRGRWGRGGGKKFVGQYVWVWQAHSTLVLACAQARGGLG